MLIVAIDLLLDLAKQILKCQSIGLVELGAFVAR